MKDVYLDNMKQIKKELRAVEIDVAKKWGGKKRLLKLVSNNLDYKFGKAEYIYKKSLRNNDTKKIAKSCEMMMRGYAALIQSAKDNGYQELDPDITCFQYNKDKYVLIVGNDYELENVYDKYKHEQDCIIFSIEELFRSIPQFCIDAKEDLTQANFNPTFTKIDIKRNEHDEVANAINT